MLVVVGVVVRSVCCGRGWSEIEEPRLEHDVLWSRVDAETRRVGCEVDEDLVRGYLWDGEQDLELERGWWRGRGRDSAIDAQLVSEQVSVWCLEVKPFVELRVGPGLCGGAGIVYDKGKLRVESIGYLVSLLDVI